MIIANRKNKILRIAICILLIFSVTTFHAQQAYAEAFAMTLGAGALTTGGTIALSQILIAAGIVFVAGYSIYQIVNFVQDRLTASQVAELNEIGANGGEVSASLWASINTIVSTNFVNGETTINGIIARKIDKVIAGTTVPFTLTSKRNIQPPVTISYSKYVTDYGFVSLGQEFTVGSCKFWIERTVTEDQYTDYVKIFRQYNGETKSWGNYIWKASPTPVLSAMHTGKYDNLRIGMVGYFSSFTDKSIGYWDGGSIITGYSEILPLVTDTALYDALSGKSDYTYKGEGIGTYDGFTNNHTGSMYIPKPVVEPGTYTGVLEGLSGKTRDDVEAGTAVPSVGTGTNVDAGTGTGTGTGSLDLTVEATPSINFEPLKLTRPLTTIFPFSIPWDLFNAINALKSPAVVPRFEIDLRSMIGGQIVVLDFAIFTPLAKIVRWGVLITFNIGLIMASRKLIGEK